MSKSRKILLVIFAIIIAALFFPRHSTSQVTALPPSADFSGAPIVKLRIGAGLTTSTNGDVGEDTTNFLYHAFGNAVDSIWPTYGVVASVSPVVDLVANFGCDPTGIASANTCLANAHNYFNGKNGGTIKGCGIFNLTTGPWVITNAALNIEGNCGGAGQDTFNPSQRGGFRLTSTTALTIPNPTVAPLIATSNSGGSLSNTAWLAYTYVDQWGETQLSPGTQIAGGTCVSSNCTMTINGVSYKSGAFAYNLYSSTDNITYAKCATAQFSSNAGNGPPFIIGGNNTLAPQLNTICVGAAPPGSNTTNYAGTLIQLGTPTTSVSGVSISHMYLLDSAHVLGAGMVVINCQACDLYDIKGDGFIAHTTQSGTQLGGNATWQGGGLIFGCVNAPETSSGVSSNGVSLHTFNASNSYVSIQANCSGFSTDGMIFGTVKAPGIFADIPGGNIQVGTPWYLNGSGSNIGGFISIHGSGTAGKGINNQSVKAIIQNIDQLAAGVGAIVLTTVHGVDVFASSSCNVAGNCDATRPFVQLVGTNTSGNHIVIPFSSAGTTGCPWGDGTTCKNDPAHANSICWSGIHSGNGSIDEGCTKKKYTAVLGTGAITNGTCATVVSTAVTGLTTDGVVGWTFASDPSGVTGYGSSGGLNITSYATAGNANVKVCNPTTSSITPGAMTLNLDVGFR